MASFSIRETNAFELKTIWDLTYPLPPLSVHVAAPFPRQRKSGKRGGGCGYTQATSAKKASSVFDKFSLRQPGRSHGIEQSFDRLKNLS